MNQNTCIYDIGILYMYLPEHIETRATEMEMKGGYSAAKLLERDKDRDTMFGGSPEDSRFQRNLGSPEDSRFKRNLGSSTNIGADKNESLLERIRDLHVPLGLVSRRYPPSGKRGDERDADTWLPTNIFDKLETMIFKSKSKNTRKNLVKGNQRTLKKHLDK